MRPGSACKPTTEVIVTTLPPCWLARRYARRGKGGARHGLTRGIAAGRLKRSRPATRVKAIASSACPEQREPAARPPPPRRAAARPGRAPQAPRTRRRTSGSSTCSAGRATRSTGSSAPTSGSATTTTSPRQGVPRRDRRPLSARRPGRPASAAQSHARRAAWHPATAGTSRLTVARPRHAVRPSRAPRFAAAARVALR